VSARQTGTFCLFEEYCVFVLQGLFPLNPSAIFVGVCLHVGSWRRSQGLRKWAEFIPERVPDQGDRDIYQKQNTE
jgi:hypothetical protein